MQRNAHVLVKYNVLIGFGFQLYSAEFLCACRNSRYCHATAALPCIWLFFILISFSATGLFSSSQSWSSGSNDFCSPVPKWDDRLTNWKDGLCMGAHLIGVHLGSTGCTWLGSTAIPDQGALERSTIVEWPVWFKFFRPKMVWKITRNNLIVVHYN